MPFHCGHEWLINIKIATQKTRLSLKDVRLISGGEKRLGRGTGRRKYDK